MQEQHNPQWIGEGRVLVADSGNDRVTELHREDGRWRPAVNWTGANGQQFFWPRDADLLENGNILVTDSRNHRVVEITRGGETVWSVNTGRNPPSIPYEADRLPHGEYPPELRNDSGLNGTPGTTPDQYGDRTEIPGITLLFNTLVGVVPIPYWVNQWHLLGLLITLLSSGVGMVWAYRDG
jgi:hypothetical protein